jgi:adenosylmethionine-8-amino-7-oxononanoate aminotransferase
VIEKWDAHTYPLWHGLAPMSYILSAAGPAEVLVGGEGSWVVDRTGRRFLDARAGIANMMLGYSRHDVVEAMTRQAMRLPFVCTFRYERPAQVIVDYAQALVDAAPATLTRVRFTHTGSSAVESALLMARLYHRNLGRPGKVAVVGLQGGYHGSTLMTMAAGGYPTLHDAFGPMPEGFHHVPPPQPGTCPTCQGGVDGAICANPMFAELAAIGTDRVAAIIVEPVMGLTGIGLPAHYLRALRNFCDRENIVLIFDEVLSGFGRMGPMFAAEISGIAPDIMCLSKGTTSGYATLGAVLCNDRIYEAFDGSGRLPFTHGSSTDSHPISCAAGLAVLNAYRAEDILEQGLRMGTRLRAGLADHLTGVDRVRGIRQLGSFIAIDLLDADGQPASIVSLRHLQAQCERRNVLIDYMPDFLMLFPPLTTTDEDVEVAVASVAETIALFREHDIDASTLRPPSVSGRR